MPIASYLMFRRLVRRMLACSKRPPRASATRVASRGFDAWALCDVGGDRSEIASVAADLAGDARAARMRSIAVVHGL